MRMMVMTHAFGRYSAHHYRTTVQGDEQREPRGFAAYIAEIVEELI